MTNYHKILWAEGTLLGQQHFQQWDHYHAAHLDYLTHILYSGYLGLNQLVIDENLLATGHVVIKKIEAIFPKGLILHYDHRYDGELALIVNKSCSIYLGIALSTTAKNITGYPGPTTQVAWLASYREVLDDYDAQRAREVGFLKPNLTLLLDTDDRSHFFSFKILELIQTSHTHYQQADFIPPVIVLAASDILMNLLRSQQELLLAKIKILRGRLGATGFNQNDLTDFFLLTLFNQLLPKLIFYTQHPNLHPKDYYLDLCQFLNTLSSFTDFISLPQYEHDDLYKTFNELNRIFQEVVETVIPTRMSALKLKRENDVLYAIDSIDSRVFEKNSFYLAVFFETDQIEWISQFTRQVKISARSVIESIVASALPGVRLVHTQRPPNRLPIKAGYEYFYIEPLGHFWEQIKSERTLGLFASYDFAKAQIELVTVED